MNLRRTENINTKASDLEEMLPNDKMAEQAVLGAILINNSIILQILDILNAEDFFSPAHKLIFSAMQEMVSKEPPIPIDELTLLKQLESRKQLDQTGGVEYLNELSRKTPVAENATCGIAIGFEDQDAPINKVRSSRAAVEDFAVFIDR